MVEIIAGIQFAALEIRIFLQEFLNLFSDSIFLGLNIIMRCIARRIDDRIGKKVNPIVTPKAPLPIKTKTIPKPIFALPETIVITGNIFVFKEEMIIERNNVVMADEAINRIAKTAK